MYCFSSIFVFICTRKEKVLISLSLLLLFSFSLVQLVKLVSALSEPPCYIIIGIVLRACYLLLRACCWVTLHNYPH